MRITFLVVGALAVVAATALIVATALSVFKPLTGYSAGVAIALGGTLHLLAGVRNYQGHGAFITGIALSTLALAALGGEMDQYMSGDKEEFGFGLFLVLAFLAFGVFLGPDKGCIGVPLNWNDDDRCKGPGMLSKLRQKKAIECTEHGSLRRSTRAQQAAVQEKKTRERRSPCLREKLSKPPGKGKPSPPRRRKSSNRPCRSPGS